MEISRNAKKGVAIWTSSSPDLDGLLVDICSMNLELRLSQYSCYYKDLKMHFKKSFEMKIRQE
jgi:hypothetical protein